MTETSEEHDAAERHPPCVCGCPHSVHQEPDLGGCMECECTEFRPANTSQLK